MPRNGSGTYALPAGNPVSSGTLIEASWANTTLSDIASAVTDSLARSGEGGMTGPMRATDGTISTPSVSFVSETATGFYRAGATDVRFAMAGVDVATLTTAGVTVGSTKVLALPDGTAAAPALTNTGDTNTGVFFPDADTVGVSTGGTERLRVDASGNLGIGTTSPSPIVAGSRVLEVSGAGDYFPSINLARTGASGYTNVNWKQFLSSDGGLYFRQNSTDRMVLDSSGNLGLGVTPSASMIGQGLQIRNGFFGSLAGPASHVYVAANAVPTSTTDEGFTTWKYLNSAEAVRFDSRDGKFRWYTAPSGTAGDAISFGDPKMTLTSGGDLLVGATSVPSPFTTPAITAYRSGSSHSLVATGNSAGFDTIVSWNRATAGDNRFIEFGTEGTYTARGSIDYNRAGGLVRYNTTSDYRAKDIIGPVQNPGATIDALKVYEGVMKGATQSRPMLIAHEAQEHAPYAVSGVKDELNEDGTPKFQQMDVSSLVPLLLAEIQSLRARVAQLEAQS